MPEGTLRETKVGPLPSAALCRSGEPGLGVRSAKGVVTAGIGGCGSRKMTGLSRAVQELYEKASELAADERAELAGRLLESIEQTAAEGGEEAWAAEVETRLAENRAGRARTR